MVDKHLVEFEKLEWIEACEGMRYKKFEKDHKVLRLMELTEQYHELEWCLHGHIGIILEGAFKVEFENHIEVFNKGDIDIYIRR